MSFRNGVADALKRFAQVQPRQCRLESVKNLLAIRIVPRGEGQLVVADAADYCGILTMIDKAINLLVAFDSDERERAFFANWAPALRGSNEIVFGLKTAVHYALRPWRMKEALFLLNL